MCTDSEQQQCVEIENRVRYAYLRGRNVYRIEEVSVHLQTSGFAMCTSQGCFGLFRGRYVYPYLHIYQAGAQRTLGAVAPALLIRPLSASLHHRWKGNGAHPMHPMHHVHQCTRFTTTLRSLTRTALTKTDATGDVVKQLCGMRLEAAYALAARGARCRQNHRVGASSHHNLQLATAERRAK